MILIQTAIRQEFQAIAGCLTGARYSQEIGAPPPDPDSQPLSKRRAVVAEGKLADQACTLLMTGLGQASARRRIRAQLEVMSGCLPKAILSIGLAGGLVPELRIGDAVLASVVHEVVGDKRIATRELRVPGDFNSRRGVLLSLDQPALTSQKKKWLAANYDGVICDMETAAVAAAAYELGIPCIGARVVSDTAEESLPAWLLKLSSQTAAGKWSRAAASIASHPQDLPRLVRLGMRMRKLDAGLRDLVRRVVRSGMEFR